MSEPLPCSPIAWSGSTSSLWYWVVITLASLATFLQLVIWSHFPHGVISACLNLLLPLYPVWVELQFHLDGVISRPTSPMSAMRDGAYKVGVVWMIGPLTALTALALEYFNRTHIYPVFSTPRNYILAVIHVVMFQATWMSLYLATYWIQSDLRPFVAKQVDRKVLPLIGYIGKSPSGSVCGVIGISVVMFVVEAILCWGILWLVPSGPLSTISTVTMSSFDCFPLRLATGFVLLYARSYDLVRKFGRFRALEGIVEGTSSFRPLPGGENCVNL